MKTIYKVLIAAGLFGLLLYLPAPAAAQQTCYFHWGGNPPWGGNAGPFSSYGACVQGQNSMRVRHAQIGDWVIGPCTCSGSAAPSNPGVSAPNAADEVEREHEAWLREEREKEEKAKTDAAKQQEFNEEKNNALQSMKGLYGNDDDLKGVGDSSGLKPATDAESSPSGLKPVTPPDMATHSVAGPFGEREIVAAFGAPLNTEPQVVVGAWHQLHCGASISRAATVVANSGSIEDVKYLAGQAADAMNGSPVEVPCNQGGAPPVIVNHSTVEQYRAYLPRVMDRIAADTEKLRADRRASRAEQRKVEQAGEQVKQLKAKAAQLQSRPAAPAAQKQQADDALAIAERALAKAQQAKQQADVAASGAQQDLSKIRQANDAVAQHPDQANAIFSQLMGGGGANSPSSR